MSNLGCSTVGKRILPLMRSRPAVMYVAYLFPFCDYYKVALKVTFPLTALCNLTFFTSHNISDDVSSLLITAMTHHTTTHSQLILALSFTVMLKCIHDVHEICINS